MRAVIPISLLLATLGQSWATGTSTNLIGKRAPKFKLTSMSKRTVVRDDIAGKPSVLIVCRSRKAALTCRDWMLALDRHFGTTDLRTFNVVVAHKPWYMPRFLVRRELRKIAPPAYDDRVLIDWGDDFALAFDIPKHEHPTLLVLDANAVLRWRFRGTRTAESWKMLSDVLDAIIPPSARARATTEDGRPGRAERPRSL